MGITHIEVEVASITSPESGERVKFMVDSGAVYSVVPADILVALGIQPLAVQSFILADGSKIERRKGGAVFRYNDRVGTADVIFGETGDANLLGALTLEALGLGLDPLQRKLISLPMMLATDQECA